MSIVSELTATLDKMVNDQFESLEFKNFFSVPLTMERGRFYVIQNAHYTANRRDCWGYVQGAAPLEVKRVIWQHESDELVNDPRANMDHYTLSVKQGEVLGLKPEDFEKAELPAMVRACFYAWHHIAMRSHWLTAYTASHMLERRNNGQIVKDVHAVADTEHSDTISEMFQRYVKTPEDRELVLQGARDCMAIDRAYRGALGYYMEQFK